MPVNICRRVARLKVGRANTTEPGFIAPPTDQRIKISKLQLTRCSIGGPKHRNVSAKNKRPSRFLSTALMYAGRSSFLAGLLRAKWEQSSSVPQAGLHRLIKERLLLGFGPDRPKHGSGFVIRPMALVFVHPLVALQDFRIAQGELVAQADPACDQRSPFSAVWRH